MDTHFFYTLLADLHHLLPIGLSFDLPQIGGWQPQSPWPLAAPPFRVEDAMRAMEAAAARPAASIANKVPARPFPGRIGGPSPAPSIPPPRYATAKAENHGRTSGGSMRIATAAIAR
ncbi:hypothetical protein COCNU_01G013480 [Cocos nucifera]|uniref:Uncharacterized protein n=1 Tax=Cocos nucifera TaxID=13894 RepID=A0A8K0MV78_COCNU|nr:hypothetical protein COCNU_01G013480 [Cocos nucifera]